MKSLFLVCAIFFSTLTIAKETDHFAADILVEISTNYKTVYNARDTVQYQNFKPSKKLHFTLHSLDIYLKNNHGLTHQELSDLKKKIEDSLNGAGRKAITQLKNKKQDVVLPFKDIELFSRFIVSLFDSTKQYIDLLKEIDTLFLKYLKSQVTTIQHNAIESVYWRYSDVRPHISLGKIDNIYPNTINSDIGNILLPNIKVSSLAMSKVDINNEISARVAFVRKTTY